MIRSITIGFAASAFLVNCASADENGFKLMPYSVSVGPSTLGFNVTAGYRPQANYGARLSANFLSMSRSYSGDQGDLSGNLNFNSVGLIGDYYPFEGGFRLSAGVYLPNNKFEASGAGKQKINNVEYAGVTSNLKVSWNSVAPYAGLGYVYRFSSGVELSADAGALIGKPSGEFDATSTAPDAQFNTNLQKAKDSLQDSLNKLAAYPVISIGLGYRF